MAQQIPVKIINKNAFLSVIKLLPVWWLDLLYHADPSPGDDEEVDWSLGGNIFEGNTLVVLVEELCWDGSVKNLVKYSSSSEDMIAA